MEEKNRRRPTLNTRARVKSRELISNNSGDGYENVTFKNVTRAYSILFNLAIFSGVKFKIGLYRSSGNEKESRCLEFTSSTKREIRHWGFTSLSCSDGKKWRKKCAERAGLLFCVLNLMLLWRSRLIRRCRFKLPSTNRRLLFSTELFPPKLRPFIYECIRIELTLL